MSLALFFLIAVGAGVGFLFLKNNPKYNYVLPWFMWAANIVRETVNHWGFERKYRESADVAVKSFMLLVMAAGNKSELRDLRKNVTAFLERTYEVFNRGKKMDDVERRVLAAAYVTAINYDEVIDTIASMRGDYENIEVKKATLLTIDVLGELVDLSDKLGRQYFQHLIYGINKCLILIRDNGTDSRTLKKVTSTLYRVYRLSKAYRHRRKLEGMTEGEFYDKVISIFEHLAITTAIK